MLLTLSPRPRCLKHLTYCRRGWNLCPVYVDIRRTIPSSLWSHSTLKPGSGRPSDTGEIPWRSSGATVTTVRSGDSRVKEKRPWPGYP